MDMVCLVVVLIMVLRFTVVRIFLLFELLSLECFDMDSYVWLEKRVLDGMETSQNNVELDGESEQKSASSDLPEYLKKKLRARGILKDKQNAGNPSDSENVSKLPCCMWIWSWKESPLYKSCSSYINSYSYFFNQYYVLLMSVMSFSR